MATSDIAAPYAEGLTRRQWSVLGITMLFWLFDGYETFALLLTIGPSLHQLLPANELATLPRVAAYLISITLFGWAVGGVIGGIIGDRLGRRWTMIGAVVLYSIFTGTSALAPTWQILALTRFLTGFGIGAEWGVGTSLLQETWPERLRTKGAGVLQAAFSGGFVVASVLWLVIGGSFGGSWRWMYAVGILPALFVALLARDIPESERWTKASHTAQSIGATLRAIPAISCSRSWFRSRSRLASGRSRPGCRPMWRHWHPIPRAASITPAWPGCSTPSAKLSAASPSASCPIVGAAAGRSPSISPARSRLPRSCSSGSAIRQPSSCLQIANGFLTGGLYGWFAIHPPELFPTAARSTAISLIFNFARFLAMFGPILASTLIGFFGGYGPAATILAGIFAIGIVVLPLLPETKGQPLPA